MRTRVLTAVVGIPLLVFIATTRSLIPAIVLSFAIDILCVVEMFKAMKGMPTRPPIGLQIWGRLPYFVLIFAVVMNATVDQLLLFGSLAGTLGLVVACYFRYKGVVQPPYTLWIALPTACIIAMRAFETREMGGFLEFQFGTALLLLFLCLWAGDTAAYFIGKSFGKRKLAPTISPNKTWEGAIANLLAATIVGAALANWCGITLVLGLTVGAIVGIAGQIGDLYESAWKRSIGIKDSGTMLPGHGGVLDRFDSLLFAAPPVAAILYSGWLR